MLEASLARALEAAHDAQAAALQLSGERQALQMQLAAGANEVAVLRQMVAAVEREHREATQRVQGRADEEIARMQARMAAEVEAIKASGHLAGTAEAPGAEGSTTGSSAMRPVLPPEGRSHPSLRPVGASQSPVVAERQLDQLQRNYSALVVGFVN